MNEAPRPGAQTSTATAPRAWARSARRALVRAIQAPESLARWGPFRQLRDRLAALSLARWLALTVGLGIALRLLLAPLTLQTDLETYTESSVTMVYGGSAYTNLVVYPPGWIYLVNLIGRTSEAFVPASAILQVDPNLLRLFMFYGPIFPTALTAEPYLLLEKSLLWAGDLLVSFLLYQIVFEVSGSKTSARFAFALWFLNPLVITASAVHGAYDVLPAFFGLTALYLAAHRYPFSSGAALGAGVLLKLFPIFLIGIVAVVLLRQAGRDRRQLLRAGALWLGGFGGLLLLALSPPGVFVPYVVSLTTDPGIGIPYGGFWIFSLTNLPSAAGYRSWLYHHSAIVGVTTGIVTVVGIAIVTAVLARRKEPSEQVTPAIAYAALACILVGYTSVTVAQAQYLLWSLPWLILVATLDRKLLLATVWISSLTLVYYYIGLEGPYYLFLPVAQYSPFLPYRNVLSSVAAWQTEISVVRTVIMILVFVVLAYALVRSLHSVGRRREVPG